LQEEREKYMRKKQLYVGLLTRYSKSVQVALCHAVTSEEAYDRLARCLLEGYLLDDKHNPDPVTEERVERWLNKSDEHEQFSVFTPHFYDNGLAEIVNESWG